VFAIVLGFRQGAWETVRGTSVFLLHRPMAHLTIYATKLAVGLVILLTATGVALGTYSIWAATSGTHASPFFWSWTSSCWVEWFAATMVYLAAFSDGYPPGPLVRESLVSAVVNRVSRGDRDVAFCSRLSHRGRDFRRRDRSGGHCVCGPVS